MSRPTPWSVQCDECGRTTPQDWWAPEGWRVQADGTAHCPICLLRASVADVETRAPAQGAEHV